MKLTACTIAILFLLLLSTSNAQFRLGVIGGLNISNLDVNDRDMSSVWNWGIGGVIDYSFTNNTSLRAEPMYLIKGGVFEAVGDEPRLDVSFSFMEIPLLFKYDLGSTESFYLIGGLSVGFLLSTNIDSELGGIPFAADVKDVTNNVDLSGVLGAGINFSVGSTKFFLEAKYSYGFINLQKGGTIYFTSESVNIELPMTMDKDENAYTTNGVQLMAGVTFSL